MKKLIKSYRFWTALAGSLGLLVVTIAKIFGYTISSALVEELIMAICGVLVVLGIVKKPEQEKTSTDKTDTTTTDDTNINKESENLNQSETLENLEVDTLTNKSKTKKVVSKTKKTKAKKQQNGTVSSQEVSQSPDKTEETSDDKNLKDANEK